MLGLTKKASSISHLTICSCTPESDCDKICLVLHPSLTQYNFIAKPCDLFSKNAVLDPI